MPEKYDHQAEFKAARKKLVDDITASINRAAGFGVPDLLIADQLLYVSLTMILTFLEYGYEEKEVPILICGAIEEFCKYRWTDPEYPKSRLGLHEPGGDGVSIFTEVAAISIATQQVRDELLEIARDNVGTLFPCELCGPIISEACSLGLRAHSSSVSKWKETIERTLERFKAGELRSDAELLTYVAYRGLASGTRPAVE